MKFYVASKFENQLTVGNIIQRLTEKGHVNTYDWRGNEDLTEKAAMEDADGVYQADFVVGVFIDNYIYKGAICEIGMALAWNKTIYILGDWLDAMIFMKLPNIIKIKSIEEIPNG